MGFGGGMFMHHCLVYTLRPLVRRPVIQGSILQQQAQESICVCPVQHRSIFYWPAHFVHTYKTISPADVLQ